MLLFAALALVAALAVGNGTASGEEAQPFRPEAHRWRHRLLLVFADNADHPALHRQHTQWKADTTGAEERQLQLVQITGKHSPPNAAALREQFGVPAKGFHVLLIGKDGGVKLRRTEPVAMPALFTLIDSMPMRQEEMRRGNPR